MTEIQRDLATNLINSGNARSTMGLPAESLVDLEQAQAILRPILAADVSDLETRRNLATTLFNIGDMMRMLGKFDAALGPTEESCTLLDTVDDRAPFDDYVLASSHALCARSARKNGETAGRRGQARASHRPCPGRGSPSCCRRLPHRRPQQLPGPQAVTRVPGPDERPRVSRTGRSPVKRRNDRTTSEGEQKKRTTWLEPSGIVLARRGKRGALFGSRPPDAGKDWRRRRSRFRIAAKSTCRNSSGRTGGPSSLRQGEGVLVGAAENFPG